MSNWILFEDPLAPFSYIKEDFNCLFGKMDTMLQVSVDFVLWISSLMTVAVRGQRI